MPYTDATLRLVAPDGQLVHTDRNEIYHQAIAHLTEAELLEFYRVMAVVRRFDPPKFRAEMKPLVHGSWLVQLDARPRAILSRRTRI